MTPAWSLEPSGGGAQPPTPPPSPPFSESIAWWVKGDKGITATGSDLQNWADQGTLGQDLDTTEAGKELQVGLDSLDGIPGVTGPVNDVFTSPGNRYIGRTTNLMALDGKEFGLAPTRHPARSVYMVIRPQNSGILCPPDHQCAQTGGPVLNFMQQQTAFGSFDAQFFLQAYFGDYRPQFFLYSSYGGVYGPYPVRGPDTEGSVYADQPLLVEWHADYPTLEVVVNGTTIALDPSPLTDDAYDHNAGQGFVLFNGTLGGIGQFQGSCFEGLVYDVMQNSAQRVAVRAYFGERFPSLPIV